VLKNPANQVANWSGLDLAGFAKNSWILDLPEPKSSMSLIVMGIRSNEDAVGIFREV